MFCEAFLIVSKFTFTISNPVNKILSDAINEGKGSDVI